MLIDFCRSINCPTRKVIDAPGVDNYMTKEKKEEVVQGNVCTCCRAWQYERYIEEHDSHERCVGRS